MKLFYTFIFWWSLNSASKTCRRVITVTPNSPLTCFVGLYKGAVFPSRHVIWKILWVPLKLSPLQGWKISNIFSYLFYYKHQGLLPVSCPRERGDLRVSSLPKRKNRVTICHFHKKVLRMQNFKYLGPRPPLPKPNPGTPVVDTSKNAYCWSLTQKLQTTQNYAKINQICMY